MDPQSNPPVTPNEAPEVPQSPVPTPPPPAPVPEPTPTPQPTFSPEITPPQNNQVFGSAQPKNKKGLKVLVGVAAALVVLGGGGAGAYYGVVVPNKPENVLKSALKNSLDQESVTAKFALEGKSGDSPAYKVEGTSRSSRTDKTAGIDAKVTVTGVSVSAEARYVGSSAFVKVSDLSNVTDIIGSYSPEVATFAETLNGKIADKWFEIDSTLIKEANANCLLDSNLKLEKGDYDTLNKLYKKNAFVTIKSNTKEDVNGSAATKFELSLDPKKGNAFANGIGDLPIIKKLQECDKEAFKDDGKVDQEIKDQIDATDPVPLTLWVDKKTKRIVKLASQTTEKDNKEKVSGKGEVSFDYAKVTVDKPSGAKPITSLISELTPLFQGALGNGQDLTL